MQKIDFSKIQKMTFTIDIQAFSCQKELHTEIKKVIDNFLTQNITFLFLWSLDQTTRPVSSVDC